MVSKSKIDKTFSALKNLGYAGTVQDMQRAYLLAKTGLTKGSVADLQRALGNLVKDLLPAGVIAPSPPSTINVIPPWSALATAGLYVSSGITDGRQISSSNTGLTGAGVNPASLVINGGTTYSTSGATITGQKFTGTVVLAGDNITIDGCMFTMSGANAICLNNTGTNNTIKNCIFVPSSGSMYIGVYNNGSGLLVTRCDISGCENNVSSNGDNFTLTESYLHDVSNASNPTGHRDVVEVYAGATVNITKNNLTMDAGETSVINCAPWSGSNSVSNLTVSDNFIDGGNMHTLVDLQSTGSVTYTRFIRNFFGGHTYPGYDIYWGLNNADSRAIVETEAALQASPNAILWPLTGTDVNHWYACTGLSPDRSGQVASYVVGG